MARTVQVNIVSIHESIFSGQVELAILPGEAGELGVLPGHAPLLARLKAGAVRLQLSDQREQEKFFIAGGLLEVQHDRVTVLADVAVRARDVDEAKALMAMKRAQLTLEQAAARRDFAAIEAELNAIAVHLLNIRRSR
jgi:F-type H+-transporting ATPase subunit epsilon